MICEGPRVYVASKSAHGPMWRVFRSRHATRARIVSTWIDESGPGESDDLEDLWSRCVTEAAGADLLIARYYRNEVWRGAFIEIGATLAGGGRVFIVGDPSGSWVRHPRVHTAASIDEPIYAWWRARASGS